MVISNLIRRLLLGSGNGLINTHDCGTFKYVGLDVTQNSDGIQVTQDAYIDGMCPIVIDKTRRSTRDAVLTTDERTDLKRFAGQMLWVSSQTRPD